MVADVHVLVRGAISRFGGRKLTLEQEDAVMEGAEDMDAG